MDFEDGLEGEVSFKDGLGELRPISYPTFDDRLMFRLDEAAFFLERMKRHEHEMQRYFERAAWKRAKREQSEFIYCFSAFLNSTRIAIFYMIRRVKGQADNRNWLDSAISSMAFAAFREVRNFATHEEPVRYSLTYPVKARVQQEIRGVVQSRLSLDVGRYLKSAGPPWMTLDVRDLPEASRRAFNAYSSRHPKGNSLTSLSSDYFDELEAVVRRGIAMKRFSSRNT